MARCPVGETCWFAGLAPVFAGIRRSPPGVRRGSGLVLPPGVLGEPYPAQPRLVPGSGLVLRGRRTVDTWGKHSAGFVWVRGYPRRERAGNGAGTDDNGGCRGASEEVPGIARVQGLDLFTWSAGRRPWVGEKGKREEGIEGGVADGKAGGGIVGKKKARPGMDPRSGVVSGSGLAFFVGFSVVHQKSPEKRPIRHLAESPRALGSVFVPSDQFRFSHGFDPVLSFNG